MKENFKSIAAVVVIIALLPYAMTLMMSGSSDEYMEESSGSYAVIMEDDVQMDLETYLIGVLAAQIPVSYELEALKAQAVIARTTVMKKIDGQSSVRYQDLSQDYKSAEEMQLVLGYKSFTEYYGQLEQAVNETKGQVITSDGACIEASFHSVSAGKTRAAADVMGQDVYPYLVSVDSSLDVESENYLQIFHFTSKEILSMLSEVLGTIEIEETDLPAQVSVLERDGSEYITKIQIGNITMSGEEFRTCLALPSACFTYEEAEGEWRFICKGLGHGMGLSQFGANQLAMQGADYREILIYYYENISITGE